ncbi:putative mediator of RNA polymerase II transcription subunit 26b-like protein, partial [Trifolium pratense]
SIPLDEGAFFVAPPGMELTDKFFDGMDDDGNIQKSAPLNKNQGNARRPSMDTEIKDKRNLPAFNETAIVPKENKIQQLKKNDAAVRLNKPKPVDADSGPSGPRTYLTSNIQRNGNVEPKVQQKLESSAVPKRPLNAQQDNSKCFDDAAKLEATKRRLQESYQQAENAKRQRTIQVMDINEIPKQGAGHRNTHCKPGNQNRLRGLLRR